MVEELERINKVEQLLIDTQSLITSIDELYYKKKYNQIEIYKSIQEADIKFRKCRKLLIKNLDKLKEVLDMNFNLFLALTLHMTIMNNELEQLSNIELDYEDISTQVQNIKVDELTPTLPTPTPTQTPINIIIEKEMEWEKPKKKSKVENEYLNCECSDCEDERNNMVNILFSSDSSDSEKD